MKRLRIISAIAFLLMFGVMSLHDLVPHIHHDHQVETVHQHHSHDDQGHHHHGHEEDSNKKNLEDFLILLFAHHSHNSESFDSDVELNEPQTPKHFKDVALAANSDVFEAPVDVSEYTYYLSDHHVRKIDSFLFEPLRGPPSLG